MSDNEENSTTLKKKSNETGDIPTETSPGEAYVIFIEMNNLSNKLKLLNYEDEYLLKWKMKPLSRYYIMLAFFLFHLNDCKKNSTKNKRHYFVISTNSGEQAHSFMTLGAWLIQQSGASFDKPQEVKNL